MGNVTAKTSGEIASFMTPAKTNIKSLKVHFSPKQLGTGDPSPENVREIEGWDGVEVNGSGRNLLQNANGSLSYLHLKKGTTITISQSMDANVGYFRGYDINKTTNTPLVWINQKNNGKRIWSEYTLEDDIYYAVCYTGTGMKEAQITIDGSVDFEPYQGNTISYQWKIPDEYQEVEYIESTGFSWLETSIDIKKNDIVSSELVFQNTSSYTNNVWFAGDGIQKDGLQHEYGFYGNRGYLDDGIIAKYEYGENKYFSKTKAYFLNRTYNSNVTLTWRVGSRNGYSVSEITNCPPCKIWYNSFTINGNKVLELIPCYRKSDGEIGMYDTVSQTFYTNQGTGKFSKGEDVFCDTAYGGYIDLISGELVETNIAETFTSTSTDNTSYDAEDSIYFGLTSSYPFVSIYSSGAIVSKSGVSTAPRDGLCNRLKIDYIDNWRGTQYINSLCSQYLLGGFSVRMSKDIFNLEDGYTGQEKQNAINEYLSANPIIVYYELKTPITHQLTPTQLSSFIGQNNFWSNADYVEIEYELKETEDIQKARKKIILNQPHIESINGDIASFTTNIKAPLKECKVYFNPVQEGSGDPSPDNVRNITGWDGVSVGLPDEYQEVEYIENQDTALIVTDFYSGEVGSVYVDFYYVKARTWCNLLGTSSSNANPNNTVIGLSRGDGCISLGIENHTILINPKYSINEGERYKIKAQFKSGDQLLEVNGVTLGTSNTSWSSSLPYMSLFGIYYNTLTNKIKERALIRIYECTFYGNNGQTIEKFIPCYRKSDGEIGMYGTETRTFYTNAGTGTFLKGADVNTIIGNVNWSDSVGTVYGGYVDLVKGEVVAEYFGFIADGENIKTNSGYVNDTSYGAGIVYMNRYGFPDSDRLRVNTYCNTLNPIRSTSQNCVYWATNGDFYLVFSPFSKTTEESKASSEAIEETNEWLKQHPTQIVYKLRTPIRYQLTPQQLLTFKGENNVWSDTNGQTEVKFWTH